MDIKFELENLVLKVKKLFSLFNGWFCILKLEDCGLNLVSFFCWD